MRSRVTWNCRPTSSNVRLYPSINPNRCSSTCRSRSVSVSSTSLIFSFSKTMAVMSLGFSAPLSSIKSPKLVSSLSPTGDWSEIGCCAIFRTARTRSTGRSTSSATSLCVVYRSYSFTSFCLTARMFRHLGSQVKRCVVRVVRQVHKFLCNSLLEVKMRINPLQRSHSSLQGPELLGSFLRGVARKIAKFMSDRRAELLHLFTQTREVLHVSFAALDFLIENHAVEAFAPLE